jgi:nitrite reductase (NADH) small subunit
MPERTLTREAPSPVSPSTYQLGPVERIPLGEGRNFDLDGVAVAVFRTRSGALFATQASCTHSGGPLADGIVGATTVICPLHAFRFDLASGRPLANDCAPLTTYLASITADGEVLVTIGVASEGPSVIPAAR